tara:strand:+ start:669 stop:1151 length:483 start_codon:yes stop_codon:yes gene_type:complete
MMGVGKSTLGKILADRLNLTFIDTDLNIEKKCAMKISEIFKKKGENFFRVQEEKEVLESLKISESVIALGGGAFMKKAVREKILKNSISIWLDTDLKTLNKRIKWNKKRPLMNEGNSKIKIYKLYNERKKIYKLAKHRINCNSLGKESIVKKIITLYEKQ